MNRTPRLVCAALGLLVAAGTAAALAPAASAATPQAAAKQTTNMHLEVQRTDLQAYFGWSGSAAPSGRFTFTVDGHNVGTSGVPTSAPAGTDLHGYRVIAQVPVTIPTGSTHTVVASYSGDANYAATSQTVMRSDPKIRAWVHSAAPASRFHWFHTAVTVGFTCTQTTGLIQCPRPALFNTSGKAQYAVGIMVAGDGGQARATQYVNVDLDKPSVALKRIHGKATCVGSDKLSGLASCTVTPFLSNGVHKFRVTAVDKAGNVRSASGRL